MQEKWNPHQKRTSQELRDFFDHLQVPGLLYPPNQMIYLQGEEALRFYYLKKGEVKIFITSKNGGEKTLSVVTEGNFLGEASFFDGLPRVSSAKTTQKSEIISIDEETLLRLIGEHPMLAIDLLRDLSKTVRMLSAQVDGMAFQRADQRIAQLLINSASKKGNRFLVHYTHEEIGSLIGVSRITVSKILTRFVKEGFIKTCYRSIELVDKDALQRFAFT